MKSYTNKNTKGFTLVELLIVIGILAVLSVALVLTLNPTELLRQARDSNRISDLNTLKSALQLYLADVASTTVADIDNNTSFYVSNTSTTATSGASTAVANRNHISAATAETSTTPLNVDGTGWLGNSQDVGGLGPKFDDISSGAPISALPVDPLGRNDTNFYTYAADLTTKTFEINANMESTKFANTGGSDVESTDGGNSSSTYEVGTDPGLDL